MVNRSTTTNSTNTEQVSIGNGSCVVNLSGSYKAKAAQIVSNWNGRGVLAQLTPNTGNGKSRFTLVTPSGNLVGFVNCKDQNQDLSGSWHVIKEIDLNEV